jgi:hypothetical protein
VATAVVTPAPVRDTVVGVALALLTIEADPLIAPAACGVKVTETVWLEPAWIVRGKVRGDRENPAPDIVTLETIKSLDPELVTTKFFVLGTPTVTFPNAMLEGETLTDAEPELFGALPDAATPALPHPLIRSDEKQRATINQLPNRAAIC